MADPPAAPTLDDLLAVLADGPLHDEEVWPRLGLDLADPELDLPFALLRDPRITLLPDGRIASGVGLGRGRVALHRLDADEIATRSVRLDDDVVGVVAASADPLRVHVGDEVCGLTAARDADGDDDLSADPRVVLPEGWHAELTEGDPVGLAIAEDGALLLVADGLDVAAPDEDGGAAAFAAALGTVGDELGLSLPDSEGWVMEIADAVLQVWADDPVASAGLRRPLTEACDSVAMAYGGGLLSSPGVPAHRLELFRIGYDLLGGPDADPDVVDLSEPLGMALMLLAGAGDEALPRPAQDVALASVLVDPVAAIVLGSRVRSLVEVAPDLVDRLTTVAALDPRAPGPAQLLTEAALAVGEAGPALDRLAAAVADADPEEWDDAIELLGMLRATAGDLDGASRALTRIGLGDTADFLDRWRAGPPPGVGRNDPCPCGSGRKHKQCCLDRPARAALEDRVELLWWKARSWCVRTQGAALAWADELDDPERVDTHTLLLDLALVEDAALAVFTVEVAGLLPGDEAALVESWLEQPRRLWEVGAPASDGGVVLVDLTGPTDGSATVTVSAATAAPLAEGETILAVVVPTGAPHRQVVGQVVRVPSVARADALAVLADHPSAQVLLDWVLALGPDALLRPRAVT